MTAYRVVVEVWLRAGIADPQGATIERALPALAVTGVHGMAAGKAFRFTVEAESEHDAAKRAEDLAHRLLANPVIEDAEVRVVT
jgi:phosphoribosylformylglycinamidine synthase PurS subunit